MASTVWKGHLTFGLVSFPVKLFTAARAESISFNQLHKTDNSRIRQQIYCQAEDKPIPRSEIVKGYEYEKDRYVVIEDEDIKRMAPPTAKVMEILEFVKTDEIDPIYFESSYYMLPEEAGRRPYALLQKALEDSQYVAVAKLAMHNREYTVFLRPYSGGLMLHTMYYQDEIRQVENFGKTDIDIKESELKVAHQLVEALAAEWEPKKYYDTFEANVKELIKAHLEGKEVNSIEKPKKAAPVVDLMEALKQSLAQMEGKKKGPQRAIEAQRESQVQVIGEGHSPKKAARKKRGAA